ncbi:hypothetical protein CPC16_010507 [Podila verticillata]|nr:hypothetical protein CPC16_010507 [Podila verticillata]
MSPSPKKMLASIHDKISSLVHPHRETPNQAQTTISNATASLTPSNNWDYTITFIGAKDLARGDILSSDPYLEAYLGSPDDPTSLVFITGVQWVTLNPKWDATWELVNVPEDTMMEIFVKDKDRMKEDTDLGKTSLLLNGKLEGTREHVLDIWRSETRKRGQVFIKTVATRTTGQAAQLTHPSTKGPAQFSRHTSYAAGMLTGEKKFEFYTYRIRLYHVLDIFGPDVNGYQHWNVDYDAAKRIFADTLEGGNIRNALHSQHSYLYRHDKSCQYGALVRADDLGRLLHGQRLIENPSQDLKMVVFTYSIIPKGLYFSETGAAFFQDFMSKHAMHANRAPEVVYSGEFRLFRDEHHNGDWTLLIDNNSGTYAPKKEDLPKLRELFERNFPDLVVVALDHEDPYLKEIRQATKKAEEEQAAQRSQPLLSLFGNMSSVSDDKLEM